MVRDGEGDRKQLERCHAGSAPIASKIRPIMGNDYPAEKPSIRLIHRFESNKRSFYDMLSRSKRDALWQVPSGPGQLQNFSAKTVVCERLSYKEDICSSLAPV